MRKRTIVKIIILVLAFVLFLQVPPLVQRNLSLYIQDQSLINLIIFSIRFVLGWIMILILREWVDAQIESRKMRREVKFYLHSVVRLIYFTMLLVVAVASIGMPIESFATFLGIASAGLAIALQQPILNIVGYIFILFSRLYTKGDYVQIGDVIGRVEEVNMMQTFLVQYTKNGIPEGIYTSIPNSNVLSSPVANFMKPQPPIAASFTVSITYESDLEEALERLRKIIDEEWAAYAKKCDKKEEKKLENKRYFLITDFGPSYVDITVVFKVPFEHLAFLKTHLVNAVFKRIQNERVEIAYPHMEVLMREKNPGAPKKKSARTPKKKTKTKKKT